ncbi:MAG TPA: methionine synthase, partial [Candidatus Binatia bacterium]|nr:methionine synthase [Candidatus Binatia bacterium]
MKRSTERILTTHAGSLPRPADLREMLTAKSQGQPYNHEAFAERVRSAVAEAVQQQIESGIDVINDGELGKPNFTTYARERISGFEARPLKPGEGSVLLDISGRDRKEFPEYFATRPGFAGVGLQHVFCTGPLKYIGQAAVQADIENFTAALPGDVKAQETFLPAVAPGTIEHWLRNEYYPSDEAYLYAIADAMHE